MALLSIGKKKGDKDGSVEPPSDVPDELPPLPEIKPKETVKEELRKEIPQDIVEKLIPTKVKMQEAPSELPPLDIPVPLASKETFVTSTDMHLFFSQLAQKITNAENLDEIRRSLDDHVIGKIEHTYREVSRKQDLSTLQLEVSQHLNPLRQLENQWASLKTDIKSKTRQMQQIEEKIQEHTNSLKQVLDKAIQLQRSS